jgi:hypothetical protein
MRPSLVPLRPHKDNPSASSSVLVLLENTNRIAAVKSMFRLKAVLASTLPPFCAVAVLLGASASASDADSAVGLKLVAEGFVSPVNLLSLGDGSGRLLIGDQVGTVHVLNKDGKLSDEAFLTRATGSRNWPVASMNADCSASRCTRSSGEPQGLPLLQRAAAGISTNYDHTQPSQRIQGDGE